MFDPDGLWRLEIPGPDAPILANAKLTAVGTLAPQIANVVTRSFHLVDNRPLPKSFFRPRQPEWHGGQRASGGSVLAHSAPPRANG